MHEILIFIFFYNHVLLLFAYPFLGGYNQALPPGTYGGYSGYGNYATLPRYNGSNPPGQNPW